MYAAHKDFELVWPAPPKATGEVLFVVMGSEGISVLQPNEEMTKYLNERADGCCAPGEEMQSDVIYVKFPGETELFSVRLDWGQVYANENGTGTDVTMRAIPGGREVFVGQVYVPDH